MMSSLGDAIVVHLVAACSAWPLPPPAACAAAASAGEALQQRPGPALELATRVASLDLDLDLQGEELCILMLASTYRAEPQALVATLLKAALSGFHTLACCAGPGEPTGPSADDRQKVSQAQCYSIRTGCHVGLLPSRSWIRFACTV